VVVEPLTPRERARHERGLERIRQRLFRRYQPSDYYIIPGSERVLAAAAESCWNAAGGDYRVFRFGGLSFAVDCKAEDGPCRFSVTHFEADRFSFWLTGARGHTITSMTVVFRDLDEFVHDRLAGYRRANIERGHARPDAIDF
jgi:hypothetical protein